MKRRRGSVPLPLWSGRRQLGKRVARRSARPAQGGSDEVDEKVTPAPQAREGEQVHGLGGCAANNRLLVGGALGCERRTSGHVPLRRRIRGGVHPATRRVVSRARVLVLRHRQHPGAQGSEVGGPEAHRAVSRGPLQVGENTAETSRACQHSVPSPRAVLRAPGDPRAARDFLVGTVLAAGRPANAHSVCGVCGELPGRAPPCPHRPGLVLGAAGQAHGPCNPRGRGESRTLAAILPVRAVRARAAAVAVDLAGRQSGAARRGDGTVAGGVHPHEAADRQAVR